MKSFLATLISLITIANPTLPAGANTTSTVAPSIVKQLTGNEKGQVRLHHQVTLQFSEMGEFDSGKCSLIADNSEEPFPGKTDVLKNIIDAIKRLDADVPEEEKNYVSFLEASSFEECPNNLYIVSIGKYSAGNSLVLKRIGKKLVFQNFSEQEDGLAPTLSYACKNSQNTNPENKVCSFVYDKEDDGQGCVVLSSAIRDSTSNQLLPGPVFGFNDNLGDFEPSEKCRHLETKN